MAVYSVCVCWCFLIRIRRFVKRVEVSYKITIKPYMAAQVKGIIAEENAITKKW